MMVICIELKIPLLPGGQARQLQISRPIDHLWQTPCKARLHTRTSSGHLKEVHLVSFQCSPHSTPQGIIGTFKQCARFQQGRTLSSMSPWWC